MKTIPGFEAVILRYEQAHQWLLSLITDPKGERYKEIKSREQRMAEYHESIARTAEFLEFIGSPQEKFRSVHVAGTSGKGSVTVMIANILHAAGVSVGHHTSPYLQICNEKLVIDRQMISPSEFADVVFDFKQEYLKWQGDSDRAIKYGEAWVALTYYWLARRGVDWAVIETGLGGRFDPTNVVPSSVAVITNIDFDHVEAIGPTLKDIAWHKSGIIKEGSLVVTGEQNPQALNVILEEAIRKRAEIYQLGKDFNYHIHSEENEQSVLEIKGLSKNLDGVSVPMLGKHQASNATLAAAAVDVLAQKYDMAISPDAFAKGLKSTNYWGRFEMIQAEPTVVLDGAHNPHKMRAFVDAVSTRFSGQRIICCIGVLSYKDAGEMLISLDPIVNVWVATEPHVFGKQSLPVDDLVQKIKTKSGDKEVLQAENVLSALDIAFDIAQPEDVILVTGSLYLVGDARGRWVSPQGLLWDAEQGIQC